MGSFGAGHNTPPSSTGSDPQPPGGNVTAFRGQHRDARPIRTSARNAQSAGTGPEWTNRKPPPSRWEQTGPLPPVAKTARSTPDKDEVHSAGSRFSYALACIRRRCRQSKAGRPSRPLGGWCDGTWPGLASGRPARTRLADRPTTPAPRKRGSPGQSLDQSPDRCSSRNWTDRPRARLRQTPDWYCRPRVVSLQAVQPPAGASDSPIAGPAPGRLVTEPSDAISRETGLASTRPAPLGPRAATSPCPIRRSPPCRRGGPCGRFLPRFSCGERRFQVQYRLEYACPSIPARHFGYRGGVRSLRACVPAVHAVGDD